MDMKICFSGIGMLAMLATSNVSADYISGDMSLRDAIYLYGQGVDAQGSKILGGYNCDVFQLVMDVTSGYSDLVMYQGDTEVEVSASKLVYPDRIYDHAAMFSYALYKNKAWKMFNFNDKLAPSSSTQVGAGTVFGYCYSTKPDAYVYMMEYDKCTVKFSDGITETLPDCVPSTSATSPTVSNDMSELVGAYSQNIYISSPGTACSSVGAANGTYAATFNVTVSGSSLTLLGYTSTDACHYALTKLSGDSVSGYELDGTALCESGLNFSVTATGLKKSGSKLLGILTGSAYGCTQTITLQ